MQQNTVLEEQKKQYVEKLKEIERQSYDLARNHLKGIFYLEENNGFLDWKKQSKNSVTK